MFYSEAVLLRNGRFALIWLAAHYLKKISRRDLLSVNVPRTCDDLIKYICCRVAAPQRGYSRPRWSLYLSSLLMNGVIRVHKKQTDFLWIDLTTMMNDFKISLIRIRENIDLPPLPIIMAREEPLEDPTLDFGQWKYSTPERPKFDFLDDSAAFEWPPISRDDEMTSPYLHQSPPELITLPAEQQTIEPEFVGDDIPPLDDSFFELTKPDEVEPPRELPVDKPPELFPKSPLRGTEEEPIREDVPDTGFSPGQSSASTVTPPKRDKIEFPPLDLASEIELPPKKRRKRFLVIDATTSLTDDEIRQNVQNPYGNCRVMNEDERRGYVDEQFRNVHARIPFNTMIRSTAKWNFVEARQPSGGLEGFFRERPIASKLRNLLTSRCHIPNLVPTEEMVQFTESVGEGSIFDEEEHVSPPQAVGQETLNGEETREEAREQTAGSLGEFVGLDSRRDVSSIRESTSGLTPQFEGVLQEPVPQREPLARLEEESPVRFEAEPALPKTPQRRAKASPKAPRRRIRTSLSPPDGGPPSSSTVSSHTPRRSPCSPAQRARVPRFPPLSTPPYFPCPTPPRDPQLTSQAIEDLIVSERNELDVEEILTFRRLCPAVRYTKREAAAMFSTVLSLHKQTRIYLEQLPPHTFQTTVYSDIFIDSSDRFVYPLD